MVEYGDGVVVPDDEGGDEWGRVAGRQRIRRADRPDLLPGPRPGLPGGRVLGKRLQDGFGRREDFGPVLRREHLVKPFHLGMGRRRPALQIAPGRGEGRTGRLAGEALGPVEGLVGAAEFAPAGLLAGRLPEESAASLIRRRAGPPMLVPDEVAPLDHAGRLSGVEVDPHLVGGLLGQGEPGGGQGIGRETRGSTGQGEVVDRPGGNVFGLGPPFGPADEVVLHAVPEKDGLAMVGDDRASSLGSEQLIEPPGTGRFLRLSQDDAPLSQHGGFAARNA